MKPLIYLILLSGLIAGCTTSGGSLGPEIRVGHSGKVLGTNKTPGQVLSCESPQMIICKTFGTSKYCSCQHPSMARMPMGF